MTNELLLLGSVVFIFSMAIISYRFFGKSGLYCVSAIATILANIEVLLTLGNVLFAVTFLITDILSECEGKKAANRAVWIGMFTSLFFLLLSQSWLLYIPAESDWAMGAIREIFSSTPRMLISSFIVYAISQMFDVFHADQPAAEHAALYAVRVLRHL